MSPSHDSSNSGEVDPEGQAKGELRFDEWETERRKHRKLEKYLDRVAFETPAEAENIAKSSPALEQSQRPHKKRKRSEITTEPQSEPQREPAAHASDPEEGYKTPPPKRISSRTKAAGKACPTGPLTLTHASSVKFTVFFEDHRKRALRPIRQDGTPMTEFETLSQIRTKVERIYLTEFKVCNRNRAVPKENHYVMLGIMWTDYKMLGCHFTYTNSEGARIQLPLCHTPEDIRASKEVVIAKSGDFKCHCGGLYCRFYNHPIELMAVFELVEGKDERVEVRWSKEYMERLAAQKKVATSVKPEEDSNESEDEPEKGKGEGEDEDEEYKESEESDTSSEEDDEKVVVPGVRRQLARVASVEMRVRDQGYLVPARRTRGSTSTARTTDAPPASSRRSSSRQTSTTSIVTQESTLAIYEAQKAALEGDESIDPATRKAMEDAMGVEPRRSRRA